MPTLLPLHLVDIRHRITETAVGVPRDVRLCPCFSPEISVTHIVIVRDAYRGAVPDDVAELEPELDPASRMLGVPVMLVASKEQHVGILCPEVLHNLCARTRGPARVAAHVGHDDLLLLHGIPPDHPFEPRLCAMQHPVLHGFRTVPAFYSEMSVPARIQHRAPRNFLPCSVTPLHLQPGHPFLAGFERKQLGTHLQDPILLRVIRKTHHLVPRHIHGQNLRLSPFRGLLWFRARLLPPFSRRQGFQLREFRRKRRFKPRFRSQSLHHAAPPEKQRGQFEKKSTRYVHGRQGGWMNAPRRPPPQGGGTVRADHLNSSHSK